MINMAGDTDKKQRIVVICGPTGVGKTSVAIELAKTFNGEIISADSMQIYKLMDIGTAKPSMMDQARVKHHMINIIFPDQSFDANLFAKLAGKTAISLREKNIVPFVVGGTGFYIKAFLSGLFDPGVDKPGMRAFLKEEAEKKGACFLHEKLVRHDPVAANRIHPNDIFRTVRALEVFYASGLPISELQKKHAFKQSRFNALKIGVNVERERLYERINFRVDEMISEGFQEEAEGLIKMGYHENLKSMKSIGYRHMVDFINGRISQTEAVRTMKRDTRRYSKRQLAWFKKESRIIWTEPEKISDLESVIKKHIGTAS